MGSAEFSYRQAKHKPANGFESGLGVATLGLRSRGQVETEDQHEFAFLEVVGAAVDGAKAQ